MIKLTSGLPGIRGKSHPNLVTFITTVSTNGTFKPNMYTINYVTGSYDMAFMTTRTSSASNLVVPIIGVNVGSADTYVEFEFTDAFYAAWYEANVPLIIEVIGSPNYSIEWRTQFRRPMLVTDVISNPSDVYEYFCNTSVHVLDEEEEGMYWWDILEDSGLPAGYVIYPSFPCRTEYVS